MMSPLQLDKYFLKELYFGLHEGFDRGRVHEDSFTIPKLQVGVVAVDRNPDNPLQWRFEVSLELLEPEDGEFPYKVAARVVGYFTVNESLPSERVERLARTNGPALLYSSAREIVASITGRSSFPPLLIPSVFFAQSEDNEAKPAVKQLPPAKETRGKAAKKASKKGAKKGASKKGKK
jgi:preprotein translocase subunit SecB